MIRRGMTIDDVREEMAALEIGPRELSGEVAGEAPGQRAQAEAITIEIEALIQGVAEGGER